MSHHTHLTDERAANLAENPYAGQGPVLLDVGGDVGALVVHVPCALEGSEVEIERAGAHSHHRPHVAVVARPAGATLAYTAVFPGLRQGPYELSIRERAEVVRIDVPGGLVTEVTWP